MAALWLMGFAQYQDGFNRKPRNLSDCDRLKSVPLSACRSWGVGLRCANPYMDSSRFASANVG